MAKPARPDIRRTVAMLFKFEHRESPLAPRAKFRLRLIKYTFAGTGFILFSLLIGAAGYKFFTGITWVDAFYNASMILTGMGPAIELTTDSSKIFATIYSIYSGVAFLTAVGVIFAPLLHRLLHRMHAPLQDNN